MRPPPGESLDVVDLTSHDDPAPYATSRGPGDRDPIRGRKRTLYVSLLDDNDGGDIPESNADDEPEIIATRRVRPSRPVNPTDPAFATTPAASAAAARWRPAANRPRRRSSSDDIVVVSERQFTPQDRLREIQEQHRQGKAVNPHPRHHVEPQFPPSGPLAGSNAAMLYSQHLLGGPLGPIRGRLIVPPRPRHHAARPRIWHTRAPIPAPILPGLQIAQFQESLEQRDYEQALIRSLEETTRRRELDRTKLHLPPPPEPARDGFTRSLAGPEPLVCVRCERELGKLDAGPESTASAEEKLLSSRVFVRGCGHVYCGQCTYGMKSLPTRARTCLPECMQVPAKKRGTFREMFI